MQRKSCLIPILIHKFHCHGIFRHVLMKKKLHALNRQFECVSAINTQFQVMLITGLLSKAHV